mmetsp:Transcript_5938/g.19140  ORF Transcript_5938/g.19140 Transcript_5938/m.19140 type:complete len:234 (-) Transcript_5938:994-1695(-)
MGAKTRKKERKTRHRLEAPLQPTPGNANTLMLAGAHLRDDNDHVLVGPQHSVAVPVRAKKEMGRRVSGRQPDPGNAKQKSIAAPPPPLSPLGGGASPPELRRVLHLHRHLAQRLEDVLANQARVPRGAAAADDDAARRAQLVEHRVLGALRANQLLNAAQRQRDARLDRRGPQQRMRAVADLAAQDRRPGLVRDAHAPAHAVEQRRRLLHNLLEHKMLVPALLDLLQAALQRH